MSCQTRAKKPVNPNQGLIKQAAIIVFAIFSVLLLLFIAVFFEGLMMWVSAMGEHQHAWDQRCSENESRLEQIEAMVNKGDWTFETGLEDLPRQSRVRLLASERYLDRLTVDTSGAKDQLEELSEYRYCHKSNRKINIESSEREFDFLVAVYDGSVLHDCTEVHLWQHITDDLIKHQYWAGVTSVPYKGYFEPILELKVNPKFIFNSRTGDRVDWFMYGKYQALVTRIGACTGHRSDFIFQEGDNRFRIGKGNVDKELEWVRAHPTPAW